MPVAEYAPNLVKKTIVGAGHGDKAQIRMMIGVLLPKADPQSDDAADALAIAVTHAHHRQSVVLRVDVEGGGAMIGKLKGIIDSYGEDFIILDVNGVGYLVHCSARTLQALPAPGEAVTLAIETHVREDQIRLFGFRADVEREWFRLLQTVQGVGAKVALAVLGTLKPADLAIGDRDARQGDDRAHAGRRPEGRRAHRHRTEGQGAGLRRCRSGGGAALRRARREARAAAGRRRGLGAGQSRLWSAAGGRRDRGRGAQRGRGRGGEDADPAGAEGTGEVKRRRRLSETDQELIAAATEAIKQRYRNDWQEVGAALRTRDGRIVTGVNLDAYLGRMAVCAEAVAIGRAIAEAGDQGIETIVAVRHPTPGGDGSDHRGGVALRRLPRADPRLRRRRRASSCRTAT